MIFLWAFLPIVFILDKIAGKSRKLQNLILLAASLVFYAWGEPRYMWLLLVSILARELRKSARSLWEGMVFAAGLAPTNSPALWNAALHGYAYP